MREYREVEMTGCWNAGMLGYRNNGLVDSSLLAVRAWDDGMICEPHPEIRNPQSAICNLKSAIRNPQSAISVLPANCCRYSFQLPGGPRVPLLFSLIVQQ